MKTRDYFSIIFIMIWMSMACWAYEPSEMPIGYKEIRQEEGDSGKINVRARCYPVQELLEELATIGNYTLPEDFKCNSYITIPKHRDERFEGAKFWIDYIASSGAYLGAVFKDKNVEFLASMEYNPYIDEETLLAIGKEINIWRDTVKAPFWGGISNALIFVAGEVKVPPYKFSLQKDSEGLEKILLNGKPIVSPEVRESFRYNEVLEKYEVTITREMKEVSLFVDSISNIIRTSGLTESELKKKIKDEAAKNSFISKVEFMVEHNDIVGKFIPYVNIVGIGNTPTYMLPLNLSDLPKQTDTKKYFNRNTKQELKSIVSFIPGRCAFYSSSGGRCSMRIENTVKKLNVLVSLCATLNVHQVECLFDEIAESRRTSRELAVYHKLYPEMLPKALKALKIQ